jgi:hypothetical protein
MLRLSALDDYGHEIDGVRLVSLLMSSAGLSEDPLNCSPAVDYPSEFASLSFSPEFD